MKQKEEESKKIAEKQKKLQAKKTKSEQDKENKEIEKRQKAEEKYKQWLEGKDVRLFFATRYRIMLGAFLYMAFLAPPTH